jgi:hypothetical protein
VVNTDTPIGECYLTFKYNSVGKRDYLIAYLVDIYSHIFTVNLGINFEYHQKFRGMLQPVQYTPLYFNYNFNLIQDPGLVHREHPMLISNNQEYLYTITLGGTYRILNLGNY